MKGTLFDRDIQVEKRILPDGGITGLVIGDITYQNQYSILMTHPGEYKESPKIGVGIDSFMDDDSPENLFREIRTQFAAEGMQVQKVGFSENGKLEIQAEYNN